MAKCQQIHQFARPATCSPAAIKILGLGLTKFPANRVAFDLKVSSHFDYKDWKYCLQFVIELLPYYYNLVRMNWLFGWTSKRPLIRTPSPEPITEPGRPLSDIYGRDIYGQRHDGRPCRVFFSGSAALAIGRPSSGGILMKAVDAVDLDFLEVSRSEVSQYEMSKFL